MNRFEEYRWDAKRLSLEFYNTLNKQFELEERKKVTISPEERISLKREFEELHQDFLDLALMMSPLYGIDENTIVEIPERSIPTKISNLTKASEKEAELIFYRHIFPLHMEELDLSTKKSKRRDFIILTIGIMVSVILFLISTFLLPPTRMDELINKIDGIYTKIEVFEK
ncbi:hypothetical protein [Porphyromonas gulae]|uniref:hypothetical protein n=1 Tax=Porphyromonas gulae TaxID=111105 RepID=UPI00052DF285|nr:hypothetical protein [Porphyromonas gulae]KGN92337.1 hypothetical protein HQ46_00465 [Porphyromonas gulae]